MLTILLLHTFSTLALVGLIWVVQVVQYPLFAAVGRDRFAAYHRRHSERITLVVGPLMGIEGFTAAALVAVQPQWLPALAAWGGLALVAVNTLSTALVQVPLHRRLASGFDAVAHRRLVTSNWLRTAAWSGRGLLALWMLGRLPGPLV